MMSSNKNIQDKRILSFSKVIKLLSELEEYNPDLAYTITTDATKMAEVIKSNPDAIKELLSEGNLLLSKYFDEKAIAKTMATLR